MVATLRPVEEEEPLLAELLADPATAVVRPGALSAAAATGLVRASLSAEAEEAFCLACHRATGGNPLLLHELLRMLAADDVAPVAASVALAERRAPDAVARSVGVRLARSSPAAASLARAVAVLGDDAERPHAAALVGLERHEVAPAAAALARADLLRGQPQLAFVHPVVRNAVYESIPVHERELQHARAAVVLAAAGAPPEQVAAQLLLAPPESVDGAAAALREAARRAASEGALESAATYLRRALEEQPAAGERPTLLVELAAAELALGAPTVADRLEEALPLIGDPAKRAEIQIQLARALFWTSRERDAIALLELAEAEHPAGDDVARLLAAELVSNAMRLPGLQEEVDRRLAGAGEIVPVPACCWHCRPPTTRYSAATTRQPWPALRRRSRRQRAARSTAGPSGAPSTRSSGPTPSPRRCV